MKKIFWIIKLLIIMGMFVTAYYVYPAMPEKFPTHWNFDGHIDGYASKVFRVYLFPVLTLAIAFLMPLVCYMDPRKERFKPFAKPWEVIQFIFVLFLAYMFFVMLYIVAHPGVSMNPFMMMGLGILFVLLGNYMGKIRQNYTVGIRVPWTIDNEEVWNRTHRFGGWCFVVAGLIVMMNAYFNFISWLISLITIILARESPSSILILFFDS